MASYEADVLQAVALRGRVTVRELAALLGVSDQTVRRVVGPMAERGDVDKLHGAILARTRTGEPPFLARMAMDQDAKVAVATVVAGIVADGDSIALDTGSTTGFIAQALRQHRNLTVVTNSTFVATILATIPGNRVHMAGTELRNHDGAAFDDDAFRTVRSMRVRYAVLSASAIDPKRGVMVHEHAEAEMWRAMAGIAERRIVAADHTKFGRSALVAIGTAQAGRAMQPGDIIATDVRPPRSCARVLRGLQVVTP